MLHVLLPFIAGFGVGLVMAKTQTEDLQQKCAELTECSLAYRHTPTDFTQLVCIPDAGFCMPQAFPSSGLLFHLEIANRW